MKNIKLSQVDKNNYLEEINIVLFGCGKIGKTAINRYEYFKNNKKNIIFCDSDSAKSNTVFEGINVIDLNKMEDLCKGLGHVKIVITCGKYEEVYCTLKSLALESHVIGIYDETQNRVVSFEERYSNSAWSQDGEDIVLQQYFADMLAKGRIGYYVDIGAHHPYRFSNTYWAYRNGWCGINIEPDEELYNTICMHRERDINVNCGIANKEGSMNYYIYAEKACNALKEDVYKDVLTPVEVKTIQVHRLSTVLEKYNIKNIDFMSIDVEGMELEVLRSNDWEKWNPKMVLVEQVMDIEAIFKSEIYTYMHDLGYALADKVHRTAFYIKNVNQYYRYTSEGLT